MRWAAPKVTETLDNSECPVSNKAMSEKVIGTLLFSGDHDVTASDLLVDMTKYTFVEIDGYDAKDDVRTSGTIPINNSMASIGVHYGNVRTYGTSIKNNYNDTTHLHITRVVGFNK